MDSRTPWSPHDERCGPRFIPSLVAASARESDQLTDPADSDERNSVGPLGPKKRRRAPKPSQEHSLADLPLEAVSGAGKRVHSHRIGPRAIGNCGHG